MSHLTVLVLFLICQPEARLEIRVHGPINEIKIYLKFRNMAGIRPEKQTL